MTYRDLILRFPNVNAAMGKLKLSADTETALRAGEYALEFINGVRHDFIPTDFTTADAEYDGDGVEIKAREVKAGWHLVVRVSGASPFDALAEKLVELDPDKAGSGGKYLMAKKTGMDISEVQARRAGFAGDRYPNPFLLSDADAITKTAKLNK